MLFLPNRLDHFCKIRWIVLFYCWSHRIPQRTYRLSFRRSFSARSWYWDLSSLTTTHSPLGGSCAANIKQDVGICWSPSWQRQTWLILKTLKILNAKLVKCRILSISLDSKITRQQFLQSFLDSMLLMMIDLKSLIFKSLHASHQMRIDQWAAVTSNSLLVNL